MTTDREIKATIEEVLKRRQQEIESAYYQAALRRFARIEKTPAGYEISQQGQETITVVQAARSTNKNRSII